jgi:hypothetical protein
MKMIQPDLTVADDLLEGAVAIGRFLVANSKAAKRLSDKQLARKIYHLVSTSRLPVFRLGSKICARRSALLAWIKRQEERRSGECETPNQPLKLVDGQKN